jgi:hypothetical protein
MRRGDTIFLMQFEFYPKDFTDLVLCVPDMLLRLFITFREFAAVGGVFLVWLLLGVH